jgi:glycosyltransferase involved in cell wall biosynthesis
VEAQVAVLMPTFRQAAFIARAIRSLVDQSFADWHLLIIDDGSPDDTCEHVRPFLTDSRIEYIRIPENGGLGAALNVGLHQTNAGLVAYLPSDDLYHVDHLASLVQELDLHPNAVLAYSGLRHHYNRFASDHAPDEPLQLVQVLHHRTGDRWLERTELTTDDLDRMYWRSLRARGEFAGTGHISCEWVDHPDQRHKRIRESDGGINPYRSWYGVRTPMRFQSTIGNWIDEVDRYRRFRDRPQTPRAPDGLRIVLTGELAYNAERILALEERGHELYGLWMPNPQWYNTVGPVPFGHIHDIPQSGWQRRIGEIDADVIYALLNWQAVPFAHQVMSENPGVPFVWHFKEGPFICLERGTWPLLVELTRRADGLIFCSPEMRDWFALAVPEVASRPVLILDGDLPKRDWFGNERSPRLSELDGEIHTVVPGRPIGLHPETVAELAAHRIHLHFYGDFTQGQWQEWIARTRSLAPKLFHLHPTVDQEQWVSELSQYDAGWLHAFRSENGGDLSRATWDDLNLPARIATLAVAGLPMIQTDNAGSVVATQSLARDRALGPLYRSIDDLAAQLADSAQLHAWRESVWQQRDTFTFDHHADRLTAFFRDVIARSHK